LLPSTSHAAPLSPPQSHIFVYEQGGASTLGSVALHTLPNALNGELPLDALAAALAAPDDPHFALPALVCLENTHNRCGGAVVSLAHMAAVKEAASAAGVPVHLDGARLANAAAALMARGEIDPDHPRPLAAACASADSVSLCLSKGLGAPVGSVLCGAAPFIDRARRARKALGGGMRQAGLLAAPARLALAGWRALAADNARAAALAAGLSAIPHLLVLPGADSNIVVFGPQAGAPLTADDLVTGLADRGVRVAAMRGRVRAVTSSEVGDGGVERAISAAKEVVAAAASGALERGRHGAAYGGLTDQDTQR
jgi:threonine aldolase